MARSIKYTGVSAETVEALGKLAERGGRIAPHYRGKAPTGAPKLEAKEVSAKGRRALEAAGYRTPESFRGIDLDSLDGLLSIEDLDKAQAIALQAVYKDAKLSRAQLDGLIRHRVIPGAVDFLLPACGNGFADPEIGNFELSPDVRDRLEEVLDRLPDSPLGRFPHAEPDPPPWKPRPEPRPAPEVLVDLVSDRELEAIAPEEWRIRELLELGDDELGKAAVELALGAQLQARRGNHELAVTAVERLAALEVKETEANAILRDALAPAIGLGALRHAGGSWREQEAARVAREALPGSGAARLAKAAWLGENAQAQARAMRRTIARRPGPGTSRARSAAAAKATAGLLGVDEQGAPVAPAVTTQGLAALADVQRALYVALSGDGSHRVLAKDAPAGLANRAVPPDATWLVGAGGLSAMGNPATKAMAMRSLSVADILNSPPCVPLGGDMFRFDWLLRETRELTDDLAHLDDLISDLIAYLGSAIEDLSALGSEVIGKVEALIEEIRRQAQAIVEQLRETVGGVLAAALKAASLLGLLEFMSQWPHDQWLGLIGAIIAGIGDPIAAAMNWLEGELDAGLGSVLDPIIADFNAFAGEVTGGLTAGLLDTLIDGAGNEPGLLDQLAGLLAQTSFGGNLTDATAEAERLLAPLRGIASESADLLTGAVATAVAELEALKTGFTFSTELKVLILAYLIAPLVAVILAAATTAIILVSGGAGVLAVISTTLLVAGLELLLQWGAGALRALIVGALADLLGLARDLQGQARAGLSIAQGLLGDLVNKITAAGGLEGALATLRGVLDELVERLDLDELEQLRNTLFATRDILRGQITTLLLALDRSFFRETLIPGAPLGELELLTPPAPNLPPADADITDIGVMFDELRLGSQVSSIINSYEPKRVSLLPALGLQQEFTHVLSLLDILGDSAGSVPSLLQPLEQLQTLLRGSGSTGAPVPPLALPFTIATSLLDRVAPGIHGQLIKDVSIQIDFEPIADEGAFSALATQLAEAAGGSLDPAMASRATPFSLPGLPIVPLRLPTGLPVALKQPCGSAVRVHPGIAALFRGCTVGGDCDEALPPEQRPPSLVNVELLDDPNPGAHEDGYRLLRFRDGNQQVLFSHFELARDSLRFVAEPKQLKAFENRGLLGGFELEVPAAVRQFISHDLPPIRDVRLAISSSGQWSDSLKQALTAPPPATTLHAPPTDLPATLDELLDSVDGLLDAANLGNLISIQDLFGLPGPLDPANSVIPLVLPHTQLTNATAVLTGSPGTWTVTELGRPDGTLVPVEKMVRVVGAQVSLAATGSLLGGVIPDVPATLSYTPAGGSIVNQAITIADGAASVPGSAFGSPTGPLGAWKINLGTIPIGLVLSQLAVTVLTEVAP